MNETQAQTESNPYHWRRLLSRLDIPRENPLPRLSRFLRMFPMKAWQTIRAYFRELHTDPSLRYKTVALSCAALFLCVCILSASNPFHLFLPPQLPRSETRSYIDQYGLSKGSGKLIAFKRALQKEGSITDQALRSLQMISLPLHYRDAPPGSGYQELEALPSFALAIRHVWFQKEKGLLLIDLREETLERELDSFFQNATVSDKRRRRAATAWFESATASTLLLSEKIQEVGFSLDGKTRKWDAVDWDLTRRYR